MDECEAKPCGDKQTCKDPNLSYLSQHDYVCTCDNPIQLSLSLSPKPLSGKPPSPPSLSLPQNTHMTNEVAIAVGVGCGIAGIACLAKGLLSSSSAAKDSPNKVAIYALLPKKGDADYKEVSLRDLQEHTYPAPGEHLRPGAPRSWIMLYGLIIDVSDYLDEHPGGGEIVADFVDALKEYAEDPEKNLYPDAEEDYEISHTVSVSQDVAGKTGPEGKRPIYIGHYVEKKGL